MSNIRKLNIRIPNVKTAEHKNTEHNNTERVSAEHKNGAPFALVWYLQLASTISAAPFEYTLCPTGFPPTPPWINVVILLRWLEKGKSLSPLEVFILCVLSSQ